MPCSSIRASPQGFVGKDGVGERGKGAWHCPAAAWPRSRVFLGQRGLLAPGIALKRGLEEAGEEMETVFSAQAGWGSGWHPGCCEDAWISREANRAAQSLFKCARDSEHPSLQRRGTVLPRRILWDSPGPPEPPLLL